MATVLCTQEGIKEKAPGMKQLPPDTVRLLSSSQVITSVVNVVKELMENSLDAGASSIDIKLENYGLDRIEVRDNGQGVQAADTAVMAVRHYTSKIFSHDDLECLETYGFRGEALGSLCAVAEVAITTKTEQEDISTQYTLDLTGKVVSQKPSHLGQGTTVAVLRLFKNLPVRRQYYATSKKCKEEVKKVQDLLIAYAVVKPDLRLTFTHNKVVVWQKAKVSDHRGALLATLGPSVVANLLPCHYRQEQPEITLDGFFPKPGVDYSSSSSTSHDRTFIFINNRPVHHKDILKLLRQHYTAQYPVDSTRNRYPILMLKVTVPASTVDVNLTPDKTQVLLHNKEAVLTAVETLLVSVYGHRAPANPPPAEHRRQTAPAPMQAEDTPTDVRRGTDGDNGVTDHKASTNNCDGGTGTETFPDHRSANSSSSSSLAEDWIVNQIPGGLELSFSLFDDNEMEIGLASKSPERRADRPVLEPGMAREQLSAENWSRGTALTDTSSGTPLLPVRIHQPTWHNNSNTGEVKGQSSPSRKMLNAITEKHASLTAYDLISNHAMRTPLSPTTLFEKEARAEVLREKHNASLQDISATVHERWKNLGEEERKKYEEKAKNHLERHDFRTQLASAGVVREPRREPGRQPSLGSPQSRPQGQKRKAPLSNQQLLDQLFSAQPQKKRSLGPKTSQPLPFSVAALRLRLDRLLSVQSGPAPRGLRLVKQLASQSAWVVLCGRKLMLLNPFRVEEALLFKRLLENNILPAVSLQNPIQLTDGILGGAEYTEAMCHMKRGSPELNGWAFLTDARLVANGFKISIGSGLPLAERHLEVTAMADCVPFLGIEDLREILTAIVDRNAEAVQQCRPLKVTNYLQGEAVRLARQLPGNLTMADVEETILRMQKQLGETTQTCIHGRPFLQHLSDVPDTEQDAKALVRPLEL